MTSTQTSVTIDNNNTWPATPETPPRRRREDAPEFAETVPRLFRVGNGSLYNQEGWLFDEHGLECVGFWNGKDIESFDDEDTDDEL